MEQIRQNEDFAILSNVNLNNGDLTFEKSTSESQKDVEYYSFYSNEDIEVDVKMYGGKGSDLGSFSGGEGGFSYLRLNMEADTEYVITGLDNFVNAPFLFKKSRLLACVGGGGDANTLGSGAPGGGVSINGGNASRGGIGGIAPTTLGENGIFGSASIGMALPITTSGDTQASIPNGGTTVRCSKGSPIPGGPSPCTNRSGNTKFKLSDLTDVVNTKEISRGFKAGYNVLYTAGRNNGAIINQGWGGSGATGGTGSDEYGGGGGSGYIIPDLTTDIFARSEEQSSQDGTDPITSTLGGSTGPAKVVISLAEIPSAVLPGFIERPAEPSVIIEDIDSVRVQDFEPLPEVAVPPLVNPPVPSMSITSMESTGFSSGTKTFTPSYPSLINVLEKGQLNVYVKTQNIPPGVTYYWKVLRLSRNVFYTDDDFTAVTGSFTTSIVGGEVVGSFIIDPKEDNQTDFIEGVQTWTFNIYTDRNHSFVISNSTTFKTLDTSLSAPVATFSGLLPDQTTGVRIRNSIDEASTITVDVDTQNIKNGDTIYWKLLNSSGSPITSTTTPSTTDFVGNIVSGTASVSSGYSLDADGAAFNIGTGVGWANLGTASFPISAKEDVITEGLESFGLQIEYPSGTVITRTTGTIVGEVKKSIMINDTSIDPEASFSGDSSVNEGNKLNVTVNTAYLKTGDTVFWKLFQSNGSTAATTTDFKEVTGSFKVTETSGSTAPRRTATGSLTIEPKNDSTTEGTESFKLKVYRDAAHTEALHIINTTNEAFFDFNVIDTSLSAKVYESSDLGTINEDGLAKNITFKVKNLFRDTTIGTERDTFYWRIYEYNSGGVHALGNEFNNEFIKDFTEYQGNFRVAYSGDETGSVPIHENTFSIIPEVDLLDDGDKEFEIRFFDSEAEFNKPGNNGTPVNTSSKFTVKDTSKTQYAFNTTYGYGVPSDDTPSGYSTFNQPIVYTSDAPAIDEDSLHSFRLETSAPSGTLLYYQFSNADNAPKTQASDWQSVSGLPGIFDPDNKELYDIDGNTFPQGSLYGYVYTMEIKDTLSQLTGARSVAFIYINPIADRSIRPGDSGAEGPEKFSLKIFNRDLINTVTQNDITLIDSSFKDEKPKITMTLEYPSGSGVTKIAGGGPNQDFVEYQVFSETEDLKINWNLSGGEATSGQISGDWDQRDAPVPRNEDYWWQSSTSNETLKFTAAENDNPNREKYYDYTMEVSNEGGDQTSEYTLTLKVVKAAVTYKSYPLFRYARVNLNAPIIDPNNPGDPQQQKVNRFVVTNYGPPPSQWGNFGDVDWQRKWGKDMCSLLASNSAFGNNPNEDVCGGDIPWSVEGVVAFAFKNDNRPSGTYSINEIFEDQGDNREYYPYPESTDEYYLWGYRDVHENVPSDAIGRDVWPYLSLTYNRRDYTLTNDPTDFYDCNLKDHLGRRQFVSCYKTYTPTGGLPSKYKELSGGTYTWAE